MIEYTYPTDSLTLEERNILKDTHGIVCLNKQYYSIVNNSKIVNILKEIRAAKRREHKLRNKIIKEKNKYIEIARKSLSVKIRPGSVRYLLLEQKGYTIDHLNFIKKNGRLLNTDESIELLAQILKEADEREFLERTKIRTKKAEEVLSTIFKE